MKIAILTSGILPIPAVQGGAVENLIDYYLAYNHEHKLHDITIYSVWHPNVESHIAHHSNVNHYVYINTQSIWFKLQAKWIHLTRKGKTHYFCTIELFIKKAIRHICKDHFDLIVIENRPLAAIDISKHIKTPIISHIHNNFINKDTLLREDIIHSTNIFIVVSNFIKHEIEKIGIPTNVQTVYNGLNQELFKYHSTQIKRTDLGFSDKDFIVIYTGRIIAGKGVEELVSSFSLLKDYPDIKLLIVGGNNYGDSSQEDIFYSHLLNKAKQFKGRIVFTGYLPYNQIYSFLAMAQVAVFPSHINEAFGMTCIEATAMGLPVIATNDGGLPEALSGQKCIIIDKKSDIPQQIANAIIEIRNNYVNYVGNTLNPLFTKENFSKRFFESLDLNGNHGANSV